MDNAEVRNRLNAIAERRKKAQETYIENIWQAALKQSSDLQNQYNSAADKDAFKTSQINLIKASLELVDQQLLKVRNEAADNAKAKGEDVKAAITNAQIVVLKDKITKDNPEAVIDDNANIDALKAQFLAGEFLARQKNQERLAELVKKVREVKNETTNEVILQNVSDAYKDDATIRNALAEARERLKERNIESWNNATQQQRDDAVVKNAAIILFQDFEYQKHKEQYPDKDSNSEEDKKIIEKNEKHFQNLRVVGKSFSSEGKDGGWFNEAVGKGDAEQKELRENVLRGIQQKVREKSQELRRKYDLQYYSDPKSEKELEGRLAQIKERDEAIKAGVNAYIIDEIIQYEGGNRPNFGNRKELLEYALDAVMKAGEKRQNYFAEQKSELSFDQMAEAAKNSLDKRIAKEQARLEKALERGEKLDFDGGVQENLLLYIVKNELGNDFQDEEGQSEIEKMIVEEVGKTDGRDEEKRQKAIEKLIDDKTLLAKGRISGFYEDKENRVAKSGEEKSVTFAEKQEAAARINKVVRDYLARRRYGKKGSELRVVGDDRRTTKALTQEQQEDLNDYRDFLKRAQTKLFDFVSKTPKRGDKLKNDPEYKKLETVVKNTKALIAKFVEDNKIIGKAQYSRQQIVANYSDAISQRAAAKIQAGFRGIRDRAKTKQIAKRTKAAKTIQDAFRGHLARKVLKEDGAEMIKFAKQAQDVVKEAVENNWDFDRWSEKDIDRVQLAKELNRVSNFAGFVFDEASQKFIKQKGASYQGGWIEGIHGYRPVYMDEQGNAYSDFDRQNRINIENNRHLGIDRTALNYSDNISFYFGGMAVANYSDLTHLQDDINKARMAQDLFVAKNQQPMFAPEEARTSLAKYQRSIYTKSGQYVRQEEGFVLLSQTNSGITESFVEKEIVNGIIEKAEARFRDEENVKKIVVAALEKMMPYQFADDAATDAATSKEERKKAREARLAKYKEELKEFAKKPENKEIVAHILRQQFREEVMGEIAKSTLKSQQENKAFTNLNKEDLKDIAKAGFKKDEVSNLFGADGLVPQAISNDSFKGVVINKSRNGAHVVFEDFGTNDIMDIHLPGTDGCYIRCYCAKEDAPYETCVNGVSKTVMRKKGEVWIEENTVRKDNGRGYFEPFAIEGGFSEKVKGVFFDDPLDKFARDMAKNFAIKVDARIGDIRNVALKIGNKVASVELNQVAQKDANNNVVTFTRKLPEVTKVAEGLVCWEPQSVYAKVPPLSFEADKELTKAFTAKFGGKIFVRVVQSEVKLDKKDYKTLEREGLSVGANSNFYQELQPYYAVKEGGQTVYKRLDKEAITAAFTASGKLAEDKKINKFVDVFLEKVATISTRQYKVDDEFVKLEDNLRQFARSNNQEDFAKAKELIAKNKALREKIDEQFVGDKDEDKIKRLMAYQDLNFNINAADQYGRTALHYAALKGNLDFVEELLTVKGIDISIKDKDGKTAVDLARKAGKENIAAKIVAKEIKVAKAAAKTQEAVAKVDAAVEKMEGKLGVGGDDGVNWKKLRTGKPIEIPKYLDNRGEKPYQDKDGLQEEHNKQGLVAIPTLQGKNEYRLDQGATGVRMATNNLKKKLSRLNEETAELRKLKDKGPTKAPEQPLTAEQTAAVEAARKALTNEMAQAVKAGRQGVAELNKKTGFAAEIVKKRREAAQNGAGAVTPAA